MCNRKGCVKAVDASMVAASTQAAPQSPAPPSGPMPFDLSQPPVIEGFFPSPKIKDETFKEKFIRKTKENPFVPIGELHKENTLTAHGNYTTTSALINGVPLVL